MRSANKVTNTQCFNGHSFQVNATDRRHDVTRASSFKVPTLGAGAFQDLRQNESSCIVFKIDGQKNTS